MPAHFPPQSWNCCVKAVRGCHGTVSSERSQSAYLLLQQRWHIWWHLSFAFRKPQLCRFSSHFSGLPFSSVSFSLCLVSTSCSVHRCHTNISSYSLAVWLSSQMIAHPQWSSWPLSNALTHIFLFCYGGSILHLLRPKPLKSSLILLFLSSLPVFQEILLVLPSEIYLGSDHVSFPHCFHCLHPSSGLFQQLPNWPLCF